MTNDELRFKAIKVIDSCTKIFQLDVAKNYCRRVSNIISKNQTDSLETQQYFEGIIKLKTKQLVDGGKNL